MKPAILKKWVPAVLAPAVIITFAVGASLSANAQVKLEPKTPQQLLEMIASAKLTDFSGNTTATFDVGLPKLPDVGGSGKMQKPGMDSGSATNSETNILSALSELNGTHEARVFVDGPDKAKIQVMDGMDEQDYIRNGNVLWKYDSSNKTAVRTTLPKVDSTKLPEHNGTPPTPAAVAESLIAAMGPQTQMSVQDGTRVAGRDAYTLELVPKSEHSLVAKVSVGVDAATGTPLQVSVDAVGQQAPAVSVGFTSFTPGIPAAKLFEFTPPAGAKVTEKTIPQPSKQQLKDHTSTTAKPSESIKGSGWDSVVIVAAKDVPKTVSDNALLNQLATPVQGGKLLHTSLLNILLTSDGRMVAGSVSLARLQAVANGQ